MTEGGAAPLWTGRCICGAVTVAARGTPTRVGLCHCLTCQRETGSAFIAFAVWPEQAVAWGGDTRDWGENRYRRRFCVACGARVGAAPQDGEVELRLGVLDDGHRLRPSYELWTSRRQPWLAAVPGATQHAENGPG